MPKSPAAAAGTPGKKNRLSWPDIWFRDRELKHVVFKMHLDPSLLSPSKRTLTASAFAAAAGGGSPAGVDRTGLLSDDILLLILAGLPHSQLASASLVSRRWLTLAGRLLRSIRVLDWSFLSSGRLAARFPDLNDVDLVAAAVSAAGSSSGIAVSNPLLSLRLDPETLPFVPHELILPQEEADQVLAALAGNCPNLRRLALLSPTAVGLSTVAAQCPTLQELDLHRCADAPLRGLAAFGNLQILRLVGRLEGFYESVVSDIGLTILAHGCKRLVKLELVGCEGSYDGISAIGRCCPMLEELTISDHQMDGGWLAGLAFCGNLKNLRIHGCKKIDVDPGPAEHLGSCPTLERLQIQRCDLRDKASLASLFLVCDGIKEMELLDCWGIDNDMFSTASICRRVRALFLEGCSLLTAEGLESILLSWKELQRIRVVSCKRIKESEITPALANLFSVLKEFKWQPDSRSVLASHLDGTGIGSKGGRFFKKGL